MDINYLKSHIHEELDGAKDYIEKAIEFKVTKPMFSRAFLKMADMEVSHATTLMNMMEGCLKEKSEKGASDSDLSTMEAAYKDAMKEYGATMTYVTNMKRGL